MENCSQSSPFKCIVFPPDLSIIDEKIRNLFVHLMHNLYPMEKRGAMSGRCEIQTNQMESFLRQNFQFENIPGEFIVQGVKSFRVNRSPSVLSLDNDLQIKFPSDEYENPFCMTIGEIRNWQKSYVVYIDQDNPLNIDKQFLLRALQGQSKDGDEAFKMKFVIRISTSPILMEFDAKIIPRKLEEDWPSRIKLVSVTGVDFAGRKHDIKDILTYLTNWSDVYMTDPSTNALLVYGGRDFCLNQNVCGILNEKRLYNDLIRMARIRLQACDHQGVQIVVETGIGLGVFAGTQIGIDNQTRSLSAKAVKQVLQQDGNKYLNIIAVIFAMPIFEIDETKSTYNSFVDIFKNEYSGVIPIFIADQDMHRLTVAIAKQGFIVSELNPADSHGVFGEYWQNRGPAVEEKLALTTMGLLVQHHLFNTQHVLNIQNYQFIQTGDIISTDTQISIPTSGQNLQTLLETVQQTMGRIGHWFIWILLFFYRKRDDDDHHLV
jgi:hypothetical protein